MQVIEIEDLSIRYGGFTAVDRLNLSVKPGEIFGLLGPNGAGKTTTFHCLTKQVPISSGGVNLLGFDVQSKFNDIKPLLGYVPDSENHFEEFSADQNLRLFARLYGVDQSVIGNCLERVELARARYLPVKAYSKGMKKKLLLARALLHQPKLLLLDEPTANLDVHSTELIRGIILDMARNGATVLVTTHNMGEVEQICDRVAIINHGKLIDLDTPTAFKLRNTERIVDVVLEKATGHEKIAVNIQDESGRRQLADLLTASIPVTIHTREFNFYQAFLRLTGQEYN